MAQKYPKWLIAEVSSKWKEIHSLSQISSIDLYYLDLAKETFDLINKAGFFEYGYKIEPLRQAQLATIIAAYFEDFVAEAGLWKAWIERHHEVAGTYLPFYKMDNYDPDYVNWQDINAIIWMWLNRELVGKFVQPVTDVLQMLSEEICELLEENIDAAPATTFFDTLYEVKDTDDFMAIKPKIDHLADQTYLFAALDGKYTIAARIKEIIADDLETLEAYGVDLIYDVHMEFAYMDTTRFGGLRMPEMAARILRGKPEVLASIAKISEGWRGEFHWKSSEGDYYQFLELETGRLLQVAKRSFDLPKKGDIIVTSLVKWSDCYWITGMVAQRKSLPKDFKQQQEQHIALTENQELLMQLAMKKQEIAFVRTFHDEAVCFENVAAAKKGMERFWEVFKTENPDLAPIPGKDLDLGISGLDAFDQDEPLAIVFESGKGFLVSPELAELIAYLKGESNLEKHPQTAMFSLVGLFEPDVARKVLKTYGDEQLYFEGVEYSIKDNVYALSWFLNREGKEREGLKSSAGK